MFSIDQLHMSCAKSGGKEHWWPVSKQSSKHTVRCSIIVATHFSKQLGADDRLC